ncbi:ABC transporter ATP-binding protein [Paraburkholderia dinghuensis]|uniref:ATP-binding cassette domain-containing protein n=1 Tax=Paraburkholderia dinghuensis TaxID=2305225 RepID=A0A3N6MZC3_9BURK|nr:ATP-binding cassette domain-containing protein [Paraburkholderia dinghuensis]RQH07385.1 ATP-binding cassette domain-containing protein [Paraburkholderia dinghuensis]
MNNPTFSSQSDDSRLANGVPIVDACQISRRDPHRGLTLLQPTDFALHPGERAALTGPSGSGKSVFLRALALLDPLDSGTIRWNGHAVPRAGIPRFRRHVAYLRQRPALLDGTVEDNLRYPYSLAVYRGEQFNPVRIETLLAAAGRAADFLARPASELSGGEAQIVALVRVLQLDPEVLLLDEPTASLDPDSVRAVETIVAAWFGSDPSRRATIWVSHDRAQAARVGNRRLAMNAGALDDEAGAAHPAPLASPVTGAAR